MYFDMKILALTAIRSDYDLMSGIYKYLANDDQLELKLLVTGAHLAKASGYSVSEIEKDNFDILLKIESLIDADSLSSRIKSASIFLQNSIDIVRSYNPDLIIYPGDREEVMIGALLGSYLNIPTAHFFGGDHAKDGHVDNPVRHAVSKLSTTHFVTLEEHKNRLLKMGEPKERIFVIGNPALDRFYTEKIIEKEQIMNAFNHSNFQNFALLIFHPITEEIDIANEYFENILYSLEQKGINTFVSYPNIDPGNSKIIEVMHKYQRNKNFIFYKNLSRQVFVSIFKHSNFIIGNSSAGILEAASIPIPAINVGKRQTGRASGKNVLFCDGDSISISNAIETAISTNFLASIEQMKNPYGDGKSSLKAYANIKTINFSTMIYKKEDALEINFE